MAQFKRLHLSVKTKNNDVIFSEFVFLEDDMSCVLYPPHRSTVVQSYHADTWSYKGPAPLHPGERPVANHTSDVIHEAVSTCRKSTDRKQT